MYYNIITVKGGTEARLENELAGSSEAINKRRGCCLRCGEVWKRKTRQSRRANRQRIP